MLVTIYGLNTMLGLNYVELFPFIYFGYTYFIDNYFIFLVQIDKYLIGTLQLHQSMRYLYTSPVNFLYR